MAECKPMQDDVIPETGPIISKIAQAIPNWQSISGYFSITGPEAQAILQENTHGVANQRTAFLRKWKSKNGKKATFKQLASLFKEAECLGMYDLVLSYCKEEGDDKPRGDDKPGDADLIKKSDKPTLLQLMAFPLQNGGMIDIAQEIGTAYNKFGMLLLNDTNGTIMGSLDHEFRGNSEKIMQKVFSTWVRGEGLKCTWAQLLKFLRASRCNALADSLEANLA